MDHADQSEQELLALNEEDDLDFVHCHAIAQDLPDINVSKAQKGLQRMASRTESIYSYDSFPGLSFPSPTYSHTIELDSPMRPLQPRGGLAIIPEEQNKELDPSKDNILAFMSTSVPTETPV